MFKNDFRITKVRNVKSKKSSQSTQIIKTFKLRIWTYRKSLIFIKDFWMRILINFIYKNDGKRIISWLANDWWLLNGHTTVVNRK